jgi:N-acetylmuramic acid 6-phosphate etherase
MSSTETAALRFRDLDTASSAEFMDAMLEGQLAAIASVHAVRARLVEAVDAASERMRGGGRLIYLGAGTSGRLATLDAAELPPTFGWPASRAVSLMAGGLGAFVEAVEGAEDDVEKPVSDLVALKLSARDVVVGIAASGRTPFVRAGLLHAKSVGALTIAILNNPGAVIGDIADIAIEPDTGAEVLAGSTRMKAGTAQKAALTCFSTGIFRNLGYIYKGRMVEMGATNDKLVERATEMVEDLTGASRSTVVEALGACKHSVKHAVVMIERGLSAEAASKLIDASGGRLRDALATSTDGPETIG